MFTRGSADTFVGAEEPATGHPRPAHARGRGSLQRQAFTLFEVMIAVMILSLITVSLYRFVTTSLAAIGISTEVSAERQALTGLISFLEMQLSDLPPRGQASLVGEPHKFNDLPSDEMTWVCKPGAGMMTTAASGDYRVTLELQPVDRKRNSTELELVLRRRPVPDPTQPVGVTEKKDDWVTLLRPVAALEIRYFHPQLNQMIERWNDQNTRPSLVRIKLWQNAADAPYEAVLSVPGASMQQ